MKKQTLFLLFFMLWLHKGCVTDEEMASFSDSRLSGDVDFFTYSGADEGMSELILYLRQIDGEKPFIRDFQEEFGSPGWEYATFSSDPYGNDMFVPLWKKGGKGEIEAIWYFRFEAGSMYYRPLTRKEAEEADAESGWMFDYFTQVVLGKLPASGIRYHLHGEALTKGWMEVETCVDSFVSVGGHEVYKGTHCWKCMQFVPDGNSPPDEWVVPGSGSHEYNGKIPTYAEFYTYADLTNIYGYKSTFTTGQKMLLNSAIVEFRDRSSYLGKIIQYLRDNYKVINFGIKEVYSAAGELAPAAFIWNDSAIYFKDEASITEKNLEEELIHAVQYYQFYRGDMQSKYKNYEFEAKVFRDLAILCNEEVIEAAPYAPVQMYPMDPSHNSYHDSYILWIEDVGQFKEFTGSDYADYANFCQKWDHPSYPGVYNSSIEPKLLKYYFPKRIPEP